MDNFLTYNNAEKTVSRWFKEWQRLEQKQAYNDGLISLFSRVRLIQANPIANPKRPLEYPRLISQRFIHYMVTFLVHCDIDILTQNFLSVCKMKPVFGALLDSAGHGGLGPTQILQKYSTLPDEPIEIIRILSFLTLSNIHFLHEKHFNKIDKDLIAPVILGCLSQKNACSKHADRNKRWLLSHSELIKGMAFPGYSYTNITQAWMFCSYAEWKGKHKLKTMINQTLAEWMQQANLLQKAPLQYSHIKKKPTVLIFAEQFSNMHAMFRCHGKSAKTLNQKFETILMTNLTGLNAEDKQAFNKTINIDVGSTNIELYIKLIRRHQPDLIYYPSVGMSAATIYLSNLRLAPIQLLTMGHPASTFSEHMDYVIINNDLRPDPVCFSEKIIHRSISSGYIPHPDWSPRKLKKKAEENEKNKQKVAVLGFSPKITYSFLQVCKLLQSSVTSCIEFHFFPNNHSVHFNGFHATIKQLLPTAIIHTRSNYENYMNTVNEMDLVLSTFPFGNTNGTIDALLLNKPVLTLEGPEPHSKTDARLLRKAKAPREMIASTAKEYYHTALKWLSNPDQLSIITEQLKELDIESIFFTNQPDSDFDNVISLLYELHTKLQKDHRREFEYQTLQEMSKAQSIIHTSKEEHSQHE